MAKIKVKDINNANNVDLKNNIKKFKIFINSKTFIYN